MLRKEATSSGLGRLVHFTPDLIVIAEAKTGKRRGIELLLDIKLLNLFVFGLLPNVKTRPRFLSGFVQQHAARAEINSKPWDKDQMIF